MFGHSYFGAGHFGAGFFGPSAGADDIPNAPPIEGAGSSGMLAISRRVRVKLRRM